MSLNQISVISKNTFLEAVRSKILHSVLLFGVLIVGVAALFGSVSIGETFRVIKSFGYAIISISSVICVVIAGVSLFQKEIAQKTIYNILSKPISRGAYIVGKFIGLWITGVVLSLLMMSLLLIFLIPFEGHFDFLGFQALFFMILELGIISAVTILYSSLSVTPVLPGLFAFATYLAGKSIYYLKYFTEPKVVNGEPPQEINPILKLFIEIFDWIVPDLHSLTPFDRLVYSISISGTEMLYAFVYSFSYIGIALILSAIVFKRRDL